uniref:Uncharacterized protein n=1 Tax=Meloidogyne incognita TaxID=6306 RepID=A0A914MQC5_MELIC
MGKPDCCANLKSAVKKDNEYYCQNEKGGNAASCANEDWNSGRNNIQKFCQCLTGSGYGTNKCNINDLKKCLNIPLQPIGGKKKNGN